MQIKRVCLGWCVALLLEEVGVVLEKQADNFLVGGVVDCRIFTTFLWKDPAKDVFLVLSKSIEWA